MAPQSARADRPLLGGLVALQLALLSLVAFATWEGVQARHGDLRYYHDIGLKLRQGQLPYRDFGLEYPPGSLIAFIVPHLVAPGEPPSFERFVWLFFAMSAALSTAIALVLGVLVVRWRPRRRLGPALVGYAALVGVSAPLLPWRYDLLPALLSVLALAAVFGGRPLAAGICLGLGAAAKLYPAVLAPVFAVYYLTGYQHRSLLRLLVGAGGAVLLSLLPFALAAPEALPSFVRYHQERGIHLESVPGGGVLLARLLGLTSAEVVFNYGAYHLESPLSGALGGWVMPTAAVALAVVIVMACRRFCQEWRRSGAVAHETLTAYAVLVLLTFIATNKVFSAQYIVWLLPFLPLLRPGQALLGLGLVAATIYLFPFAYDELLALRPGGIVWLNVRNGLLLGLLGWLLAAYRPRRDGPPPG